MTESKMRQTLIIDLTVKGMLQNRRTNATKLTLHELPERL